MFLFYIFDNAHPGSLELLNLHEMYPKIKAQKGLETWKVLLSRFYQDQKNQNNLVQEYENHKLMSDSELFVEMENLNQELNEEEQLDHSIKKNHKRITKSMFPLDQKSMQEIQIQNCMRILPQDLDSGGFFVAVIRKKSQIVWKNHKKFTEQQENLEEIKDQLIEEKTFKNEEIQKQSQEDSLFSFGKKDRFQVIDEISWKNMQESYGLNGLEQKQFFYQMDKCMGGFIQGKKIWYISKELSEYIENDKQNLLNPVCMGIHAFSRENTLMTGVQTEKFAIQGQAVRILFPYIKSEIKIKVQMKQLVQFMDDQRVLFQNIDSELKEKLITFQTQSAVLLYSDEYAQIESILIHVFSTNFMVMVSKAQKDGMKILYQNND